MYKTLKKIASVAVYVLAIIVFVFLGVALLPPRIEEEYILHTMAIISVIFIVVIFCAIRLKTALIALVRHNTLEKGETVILKKFIDRLRFCYSLEDFYAAISDGLEMKGDCAVLLVDRSKNYIL